MAPSHVRVHREATRKAVDRGKRGPASELRNDLSGMPTWWSEGEDTNSLIYLNSVLSPGRAST